MGVKDGCARIAAMGMYVPKRVLTNQDLEQMVDTSDEWIFTRTGMRESHIAGPDEPTSMMGMRAAQEALSRAKLTPADIDLIVVCTMTPDYGGAPCTAALIQNQLGAPHIGAMDLNAACSGFIYGLTVVKALIESGLYRRVLLIASEQMSSLGDYTDRSTCILWGDGAVAAVLCAEGPGLAIQEISLGADGSLAELLQVPAGGCREPATAETVAQRRHFIKMEGRETFKHAVRHMEAVGRECLQRAGITDQQLSWVVPHQANIRIMDAVAKRFDVPDTRLFRTVHKYGNSSASAIGLALDELLKTQPLAAGEHVLLVAFGAGLTWGGALLTQVSGDHSG